MRCCRITLPCVSMMETATGTTRDAAASTRSAIVFARASKSMMCPLKVAQRASASEAAQVGAEAILGLSRLVKTQFKKGLDPRLRGRSAYGGHARIPPGCDFHVWRQSGVHQTLGVGDRPLLEPGDASRECLDEPVELG